MTIYEVAHQLGQMLAQSEEFTDMVAANEARLTDDIAQKLMDKYAEAKDSIEERAQQPGLTREDMMELRKEMEAETDKLMRNATVSNYINACYAFEGVMREVNGIIGLYISPGDDECGGDCDGCGGGCCH